MVSVFRLSPAQLQRLVRERCLDTAQVAFTVHVLTQMKKRHILRAEVLEVLRKGRLVRAPEPNLARGSMECRMQRFVAGRELGVVAAIDDDAPTVVVVTAMVMGG